jgi:hypothetical protein
VQIQKANDRSELTIILSFDYSDWHLPVNLINFLENYRGTLIEELNGAIKCDIEPNEIGAHINCSISVAPEFDYFSVYQKASGQVLATYRKCLQNIYQEPVTREQIVEKTNETAGAKWWFQYVVVPILGSGAVAALAAGLIALLK